MFSGIYEKRDGHWLFSFEGFLNSSIYRGLLKLQTGLVAHSFFGPYSHYRPATHDPYSFHFKVTANDSVPPT